MINNDKQLELIRDLMFNEIKQTFEHKHQEDAKQYLIETMGILLMSRMPVGDKKYSQILRIIANAYDLLPEEHNDIR